jgi:hypothetical protein
MLSPEVIEIDPEYPVCDTPLFKFTVPPVLLVLAPAEIAMLPPILPLPNDTIILPPLSAAEPVDSIILPLSPADADPVKLDNCPLDVIPFALATTAAPLAVVSEAPLVRITFPPVLLWLKPAEMMALPDV